MILLTGDATRWVHLTDPSQPAFISDGGLGFVSHLLEAWSVKSVFLPKVEDPPAEYIQWKRFKDKGKDIWRPYQRCGHDRVEPQFTYSKNPPRPSLLVLLDSDRGFSGTPALWPAAFRESGKPHEVLLSIDRLPDPVMLNTSRFWDRLRTFRDCLTVVVPADALRARGAGLSRGLSWDRAVEEVVDEFASGLSSTDLAQNCRTVVTFGLSGVAIFERNKLARLIYEPENVEGLWEHTRPGLPLVTELVVTAGVARHLADPAANPLFVSMTRALNFAGSWHEKGDLPEARFRPVDPAKEKEEDKCKDKQKEREFYSTWNHALLSDLAASTRKAAPSDILGDLTGIGLNYVAAKAAQVIVSGFKELKAVPSARFGDFFTVDRQEIERLNTLRDQIERYRDNPKADRPLNLAVFGQPGSGKSFAIKQLAKAILGDHAQVFGFNLTQFHEWSDLVLSFHQIRDAAAKGKMPFVFWDEFDTDGFSWLKHFLAPMQDAEFHSGGHAFPFGRAIFVFAGGVAKTMKEFTKLVESTPGIKGPDFLSRLHGSLDVKGPNPVPLAESDPAYLIRRAILLRAKLEQYRADIIDFGNIAAISPAVIRAFLRTSQFRHGARSLEALVSQSRLGPSFEPADLPPPSVLRLHVGDDFMAHIQEGQLGIPLIEALTKAVHDCWRAAKKKEGWSYGAPRNDKAKKHDGLVVFGKAPRKYQESSRHTARLTEAKLRSIGLRIVRAGAGARARLDQHRMDQLMSLEHDIWLRDYLSQGYEEARKTDHDLRLHRCAKHFDDLSRADRALDLAIAKSIRPTLKAFGYQLAMAQQPPSTLGSLSWDLLLFGE